MSNFLDKVSSVFGTRNLYEVLGITMDANKKQLKKAWCLKSRESIRISVM